MTNPGTEAPRIRGRSLLTPFEDRHDSARPVARRLSLCSTDGDIRTPSKELRALLTCMPHATAYVAGPGDANEPSQYASSDTLRRRTQRPGGDLSEPAVLQAAVQDRTFRGEIILFAFNFCSISDALALMATLRRASFEHFLPFTDGRETCLAMQHLAAAGGGLQHASGTQPHHPSPSSSTAPSPGPAF